MARRARRRPRRSADPLPPVSQSLREDPSMSAVPADPDERAPKAAPARRADGTFPPLEGFAKIAGTISLALATFMNVLDTSIANVSLSSIAGDLGVSSTQATWVITSFAVAN